MAACYDNDVDDVTVPHVQQIQPCSWICVTPYRRLWLVNGHKTIQERIFRESGARRRYSKQLAAANPRSLIAAVGPNFVAFVDRRASSVATVFGVSVRARGKQTTGTRTRLTAHGRGGVARYFSKALFHRFICSFIMKSYT